MRIRKGDVEQALERIRERIYRKVGIMYGRPVISRVLVDEDSRTLFIFVPDRPDKSALLGPGAWAVAELKKWFDIPNIGVRALTDVVVKRWRIRMTLECVKRARVSQRLKDVLEKHIVPLLERELKHYPLRPNLEVEEEGVPSIVVGLSGGADSTAALILAREAGLNPIAVTVAPAPYIVPRRVEDRARQIAERLGVEHVVLRDVPGFEEVARRAVQGRLHPCGKCRRLITERVLAFAQERGIPLVSFGDLLPTGYHALQRIGEVWVLNLCAALALTKSETVLIARTVYEFRGRGFTYGCPFLRYLHKRYPAYRWASVQRVLRELRAGILEPGQALSYIKSIFS
ncbi:hypothetical protein DRN94_000265 [archaeon]|nr:hypothetical protein [archaeon]